MGIITLTLTEAKGIVASHYHLLGKALICEHTDYYIIESIAVSPYDEMNKWIFANRYMEGYEPKVCLNFYHGPYYDVLVLARSVRDKDVILYESLNNFLQHERIDFTNEQIPSYSFN